jgi:hypothetical protein
MTHSESWRIQLCKVIRNFPISFFFHLLFLIFILFFSTLCFLGGQFLVASGKEEMGICMAITDIYKGVGFNPTSTSKEFCMNREFNK